MLSETTLYCLAYLNDEQIEANGGIPSVLLAAKREDTVATAEFAHSFLVDEGLIELNLGEPPDSEFFFGEEPAWLEQ